MATMTLFHSPLSPLVRKVMVVLHETGQLDRVELQAVNVSRVVEEPCAEPVPPGFRALPTE